MSRFLLVALLVLGLSGCLPGMAPAPTADPVVRVQLHSVWQMGTMGSAHDLRLGESVELSGVRFTFDDASEGQYTIKSSREMVGKAGRARSYTFSEPIFLEMADVEDAGFFSFNGFASADLVPPADYLEITAAVTGPNGSRDEWEPLHLQAVPGATLRTGYIREEETIDFTLLSYARGTYVIATSRPLLNQTEGRRAAESEFVVTDGLSLVSDSADAWIVYEITPVTLD